MIIERTVPFPLATLHPGDELPDWVKDGELEDHLEAGNSVVAFVLDGKLGFVSVFVDEDEWLPSLLREAFDAGRSFAESALRDALAEVKP